MSVLGDGAPVRACSAAGMCIKSIRRGRGAAGCQTSSEGGQELSCCESWNQTLVFLCSCLWLICNNSHVCLLQLYPSLCELAHVLSIDGPVRQKLESITGELAKAADKELQVRFFCCFCLLLLVIIGTEQWVDGWLVMSVWIAEPFCLTKSFSLELLV